MNQSVHRRTNTVQFHFFMVLKLIDCRHRKSSSSQELGRGREWRINVEQAEFISQDEKHSVAGR